MGFSWRTCMVATLKVVVDGGRTKRRYSFYEGIGDAR